MSGSNEWPNVERRHADRPHTGDRRACPTCGEVMRFYERYVVIQAGVSGTLPAWVCRCGYEEYVRHSGYDH